MASEIQEVVCERCAKAANVEWYDYVTHGLEFRYDIDRARKLVQDGRKPVELEPESLEWCVRTTDLEEVHIDHVDTRFPGLIAHVWLRQNNGEIARGHLLIDGNHRAARCWRDKKPFFIYLLTEEESDSILLRSPNKSTGEVPALATA